MKNEVLDFNVIVIGAGAGGMCAAARLSGLGYRTLLMDSRDKIGGRASTRLIDGFLCNTTALVIELDRAISQTYSDLGAGSDEAGHAFQFEAGRVFRSEAGHPWRQSHGSI